MQSFSGAALPTPQTQKPFLVWSEPHLSTNALLCLDSSQYAIIFSQSLINADIFVTSVIKPWFSNFLWVTHVPLIQKESMDSVFWKKSQQFQFITTPPINDFFSNFCPPFPNDCQPLNLWAEGQSTADAMNPMLRQWKRKK